MSLMVISRVSGAARCPVVVDATLMGLRSAGRRERIGCALSAARRGPGWSALVIVAVARLFELFAHVAPYPGVSRSQRMYVGLQTVGETH
jgi:hypothetical protein